MFNCESERNEKKARLKTTSIWTDVLKHQNRYLNSRYAPVEFILPNSSPYKMRFWEEFFFRFNTSMERNILGGVAAFYTGTGVNASSNKNFVNNNSNNNNVYLNSSNNVNAHAVSCNSDSNVSGNFSIVNKENENLDNNEAEDRENYKGDLDMQIEGNDENNNEKINCNGISWNEKKK